MNVVGTLRVIANQLKACFYKDKVLAARIVIFIITGMAALWYFVSECIILWIIRMLQIVGEEVHTIIHDDKLPAGVRCVFMLVCSPIMYVTYVTLPFMYMPLWVTHFFYNCFAYITSCGKSGWTGLDFDR